MDSRQLSTGRVLTALCMAVQPCAQQLEQDKRGRARGRRRGPCARGLGRHAGPAVQKMAARGEQPCSAHRAHTEGLTSWLSRRLVVVTGALAAPANSGSSEWVGLGGLASVSNVPALDGLRELVGPGWVGDECVLLVPSAHSFGGVEGVVSGWWSSSSGAGDTERVGMAAGALSAGGGPSCGPAIVCEGLAGRSRKKRGGAKGRWRKK